MCEVSGMLVCAVCIARKLCVHVYVCMCMCACECVHVYVCMCIVHVYVCMCMVSRITVLVCVHM